MAPIDVYVPMEKNRYRFLGGTLGDVYRKVVKSARRFSRSPAGQNLKKGIKRGILEAGSHVVEQVLAGKSPLHSLETTSKKLKRELPKTALSSFKKSVLGQKSKRGKRQQRRRKVGGVILYRLNKRERRGRKPSLKVRSPQRRRQRKKRATKGQLLYRLKSTRGRKRGKQGPRNLLKRRKSRKQRSQIKKRRRGRRVGNRIARRGKRRTNRFLSGKGGKGRQQNIGGVGTVFDL